MHGEGETLLRHEKMLLEMANRLGLDIAPDGIFREIVSGDTIAARPEIQRLLQAIQDGKYQGCLCTEISRLARGDSIDQGIVMQTFKYARATIIVYPGHVYNPQNDFDETALEMSLFLSRQEYKSIKRRMQAGRAASVREGHYVGGKRPFGYEVVKIKGNKGYTLQQIPEEARVVRQVFSWYLYDRIGASKIANRLNASGSRTYNGFIWDAGSIRNMLYLPVYAGYVQWFKRETSPAIVDGRKINKRPHSERYIRAKGLHEPIVTEDEFNAVAQIARQNLTRPLKQNYSIQAPLAGLIKCGLCGRAMIRRPNINGGIFCACKTPGCPCSSVLYDLVVSAVLDALRGWVADFAASAPASSAPASSAPVADAIAIAQKSIDTAKRQLTVAYSMLETEVYSVSEYLDRKHALTQTIQSAEAEIERLRSTISAPSREDAIRAIIPQVIAVLEAWPYTSDPLQQNALLHSVLSRIDYVKTKRCFRNDDPRDHITLTLYPLVVS